MTRATTSARMIAHGFCGAGLACLAVITLASPGATRMYAWPWTLALAGALLGPALALVALALDRRQPLILPSRPWQIAAAALAGFILVSALASPYRGPSLFWCTPLLSGAAAFFVLVDWLAGAGERREHLLRAALLASMVVGVVSLILWAGQAHDPGKRLEARNPFPLGHSNYTAGLALLMLPLGGIAALRQRGIGRGLAVWVVALAGTMLFTSGSRGGLVGLAALAAAALWRAPWPPARKLQLAATGLAALAIFALVHPRIRATWAGGDESRLVAASEVQRTAMLTAGWRMGCDRPLIGWGPGTTPLVFPRYRGALPGGAEIVLQLHSLPVHVWAELGALGLLGVLALATVALRHAARDATAAAALFGYAAFSLTDWQLDVPVFAFALAALAALLARPIPAPPLDDMLAPPPRRNETWLVAGAVLFALGAVALAGRRDPAPELNSRALSLGRDPATADQAIALLRESLALNPEQEIAHFNLGWLLVVRQPADAERHFRAAAQLVPDKGGVYFGLGLARLNQGRRDAAARAFALEGLNDPRFLSSPWWREPAIAATREASAAAFADLLRRLPPAAPPHSLSAGQLGLVPTGPERVFRRERTGYPVLMRNLDLPTPVDLYDVRESVAPVDPSRPLPPKGWLPSPLLLKLLDAPVSVTP
jgi:O-antigen ligase